MFLDLIQPYPGSDIYAHCVRKGLIKDRLKFIKSGITMFSVNMTDSMSDSEFSDLRHKITSLSEKHLRYVMPESRKRVGEVHSLSVVCPFCEKHNTYNNCRLASSINYGFLAICRHCFKRYQVHSPAQYIVFKKMRFLVNHYLRVRKVARTLLMKKGQLSLLVRDRAAH